MNDWLLVRITLLFIILGFFTLALTVLYIWHIKAKKDHASEDAK
jgi:phage shock protein PspC (stress-responsive transcriptional regulator)